MLWVVIPSEIFSCFLKASEDLNFYADKITVFLNLLSKLISHPAGCCSILDWLWGPQSCSLLIE